MHKQVKLKQRKVLGGVVCNSGTQFTLIRVIGDNSIIRKGGKEFSLSSRFLVEVDQYGRPIEIKKGSNKNPKQMSRIEALDELTSLGQELGEYDTSEDNND